jgi:cell division protein FtsL
MNRISQYDHNYNIIDSNKKNINPMPLRPKNQLHRILSKTYKYFLLIFLLLIIALGILIGFFVMKTNQIVGLKNDLNVQDMIILGERKEKNQTDKQLNDVQSEMKTKLTYCTIN